MKLSRKITLITGLMLLLLPGLLFAGQAYVVLKGPDIVQVGEASMFTVSTINGEDSGYTWSLRYDSTGKAVIEDGELTVPAVGVVGVMVQGNDTGKTALVHVDACEDKNSAFIITGPDKVVAGGEAVFSAGGGRDAFWFITASFPTGAAVIDSQNGRLWGIATGEVIITAMDSRTGISNSKKVLIVPSESQPALVSLAAQVGEEFTLKLYLSIMGDIPSDASLYIGVQFDEYTLYLPGFSVVPEPYTRNPENVNFQEVFSVPVGSIPYNTYRFFAELRNSSGELVSNTDTAEARAGVH